MRWCVTRVRAPLQDCLSIRGQYDVIHLYLTAKVRMPWTPKKGNKLNTVGRGHRG
jgi:hypothetical protein